MINTGTKLVYLTGSKKTIKRTVWKDGDKYYIKWYGEKIQVYHPDGFMVTSGWRTLEEY